MLKHSQFAEWLGKMFPNTENQKLLSILAYTSQGISPETAPESLHVALDTVASVGSVVAGVPIPPPPLTGKYYLGSASTARLKYLFPKLRDCVARAIELTTQDFTVLQTMRTKAQQQQAVAQGNSRTLHSLHLEQPDGYAHAVDLGAWVNGKLDWTPSCYADIALAMDKAATELGIAAHIRWGGAWDRVLADFGGSHDAYMNEVKAYEVRHAGSDLIDMPHFEWRP